MFYLINDHQYRHNEKELNHVLQLINKFVPINHKLSLSHYNMNSYITFKAKTEKPSEEILKVMNKRVLQAVPFNKEKMKTLYPLIEMWNS